ncbi:gastrula zinc finger protein XlCGF17.1-like [Manduca sexta]|uniref:Uncharacterized protein n=1 Tax=Manduca sexta TaxID=7130 RepID=A0A922CMV2_MANSE|nr:gastrula zinc finger protein XlCGF17.1-like [Manduca sexta]KAG6451203.1 hypothetical protein O3G_MSEX007013 [Manduca sexta]
MASAYFMLRMLKRKRQRKLQTIKNLEENDFESETICNSDNPITENSFEKCRICLKEGNIPIYGENNSFNISESITTFGGVEINENDAFPKYLCHYCYSWLQRALVFRKTAKESDKILRQTSSIDEDHYSDFETTNEPTQDPEDQKIAVKSHRCKICNIKFNSWDDYVTHKSSRQHRNVRVQCPICHGILTAQLYKKHLARHQSASHLVCDICGKLYRKDNLVRHLQLHNYELPYHCQVCPYRGRFLESLKIHMRTHTGQKPFSCDKCELRFLTRSNLNRHLLTHKKERPHKCIECGRGFYTKRDLDVHFKADHVGVKDFGCRFCGNKYGTRKALMRHELRVHKRDKMAKGRMPLYLQEEYIKNNATT